MMYALTEEREVGGRVADELDEWLSHHLRHPERQIKVILLHFLFLEHHRHFMITGYGPPHWTSFDNIFYLTLSVISITYVIPRGWREKGMSLTHSHSIANISANFRKIRNGPHGRLRGPG
jgi:hypothetical protein